MFEEVVFIYFVELIIFAHFNQAIDSICRVGFMILLVDYLSLAKRIGSVSIALNWKIICWKTP